MMGARIIEVIEVKSTRGNGKETPIREIVTFYNREGFVLAEHDPCLHALLFKTFEHDTCDVDDVAQMRGMLKENAQ